MSLGFMSYSHFNIEISLQKYKVFLNSPNKITHISQ